MNAYYKDLLDHYNHKGLLEEYENMWYNYQEWINYHYLTDEEYNMIEEYKKTV